VKIMPIPVTVPRLGWNMEEGTFVEWLKADGDAIRPGDAVFRLESDKSVEEVESLDAGVLHIPATAPKPGDRVTVGAVIGYLLQPGEAPPPVGLAVQDARREEQRVTIPVETLAAESAPRSSPAISPRARRLAARLGIDASNLRGTGRNGRIRERDVAAASPAAPAGRVVPLTPIRKTIAARMVESRQTTAPVTLTSVVDATNLVALRGQLKSPAEGEPVPSYTDLFVKLAAVALRKHPLLTARWTDDGIILAERIDIGIAVDTDAGLLVPVVRDVPALGLPQVAARSRELIDRARRGELSAAEMDGGCFTVTNLGAYGIDTFTPIINPPQCAVLGVGRIARRPVMDGDRVVGRELVTLSLTFDHRIVDGGPAARFVQTLAQMIEDPGPWLPT
jgi:pyruvate dehydrogenase E2 component (dihydrolipoamide acetyltransferase)